MADSVGVFFKAWFSLWRSDKQIISLTSYFQLFKQRAVTMRGKHINWKRKGQTCLVVQKLINFKCCIFICLSTSGLPFPHTSSVWYPFTHPLLVSSVRLFMRWKEPLRTTQHFLDPALNSDHMTRVETRSHMILLQQSFCSKWGERLVRVQHPALCQFYTANTHMAWWANVYPQNTHARPINPYIANMPPVLTQFTLSWHYHFTQS